MLCLCSGKAPAGKVLVRVRKDYALDQNNVLWSLQTKLGIVLGSP